VLSGLAAVSFAAMVPLSLLSGQVFNGIVPLVIGVPCTGVGILVARRQPRNPLGWLFLMIAVCLFLGTDGGDYAFLGYRLGHHLPFGVVAVLLGQAWGPGIAAFPAVILLFPDGRLPSALWRWALWAYGTLYVVLVGTLAVGTVQALIGHPIRIDQNGGLVATDHWAGWLGTARNGALAGIVVLSVCFVGRQVLSWRRSSGERRQQLKWLASGAVVTIGCAVLSSSFGVLWLGFAALPASMGVAILKYRLYEIDRIISRTLAYAIVTGLLIGVYAGLVLLATRVLTVHTPIAVAAATLAAAALFAPLRRRVQRVVDRRFNRARYDADRTLAAFSSRLTGALDLDSVRDDLAATVQAALEPAHLSVWLPATGDAAAGMVHPAAALRAR
jgi:hypothetical protein